LIRYRVFGYGVLAISFWIVFAFAIVARAKIRTTPSDFPPRATDDVSTSKIASRLSAQGLSGQIEIFAAGVNDQSQLTFNFEIRDQNYIIAESNERYRELSAFRGPQASALWIKLFMAISEVSSVPLASIEGHEGLDPNCGLHVTMNNGTFVQAGQSCTELQLGRVSPGREIAAVPSRVEIPVIQAAVDVAPASTVPLQRSCRLDMSSATEHTCLLDRS
jgi:hypothetical protein